MTLWEVPENAEKLYSFRELAEGTAYDGRFDGAARVEVDASYQLENFDARHEYWFAFREVDTRIKAEGEGSLKLSFAGMGDFQMHIHSAISLMQPAENYAVTFRIRSEGISAVPDAQLELNSSYTADDRNEYSWPLMEYVDNTDWKTVVLPFRSSTQSCRGEVDAGNLNYLRLYFVGTGTVWIDDLKIVELNSDTDVKDFGFYGFDRAAEIDAANHTIRITLPYHADITSLVPYAVLNETSVSDLAFRAYDCTDGLSFTVTSSDGTAQLWNITVDIAEEVLPSEKYILAFGFEGFDAVATIDHSAKTITIVLPYGTELADLTPVIDIAGKSVSLSDEHNFTSEVVAAVTAYNGSVSYYKIRVSCAEQAEGQSGGCSETFAGSACILAIVVFFGACAAIYKKRSD